MPTWVNILDWLNSSKRLIHSGIKLVNYPLTILNNFTKYFYVRSKSCLRFKIQHVLKSESLSHSHIRIVQKHWIIQELNTSTVCWSNMRSTRSALDLFGTIFVSGANREVNRQYWVLNVSCSILTSFFNWTVIEN